MNVKTKNKSQECMGERWGRKKVNEHIGYVAAALPDAPTKAEVLEGLRWIQSIVSGEACSVLKFDDLYSIEHDLVWDAERLAQRASRERERVRLLKSKGRMIAV